MRKWTWMARVRRTALVLTGINLTGIASGCEPVYRETLIGGFGNVSAGLATGLVETFGTATAGSAVTLIEALFLRLLGTDTVGGGGGGAAAPVVQLFEQISSFA